MTKSRSFSLSKGPLNLSPTRPPSAFFLGDWKDMHLTGLGLVSPAPCSSSTGLRALRFPGDGGKGGHPTPPPLLSPSDVPAALPTAPARSLELVRRGMVAPRLCAVLARAPGRRGCPDCRRPSCVADKPSSPAQFQNKRFRTESLKAYTGAPLQHAVRELARCAWRPRLRHQTSCTKKEKSAGVQYRVRPLLLNHKTKAI